MVFISVEHLRGIWGLESRDYTLDEINASAHLRAARSAGALVERRDATKQAASAPSRNDNQRQRKAQESSPDAPALSDKQEV